MENILFLDIDDTITKPSADQKNLSTEDFNKMILDVKPDHELISEIKNIAKQHNLSIVFNTGRSEVIRAETLAWLTRYFEAPIKLLMRPVAVGELPEQIYNSKVQQVLKFLKTKEGVSNILFIDNSIPQLKRYIQHFPNDGAYSVENGRLNKGFYPSSLDSGPADDLEEDYLEEDAPEVGTALPLVSVHDIFPD